MPPRVRTDGPYALGHGVSFTGYTNRTSGSKLDGASSLSISGLSQLYRRTEDVTTPGYLALVKAGGILPMNPLKQNIVSSILAHGDVHAEGKRSGFPDRDLQVSGTFAEWDYPLATSYKPSLPSVNVSALITAVQAKANSAGWDVGTSMAEFSKTLHMVTNAKRSVLRIVESILGAYDKRTPRSYERVAREINSKWLEGRYGWRPLYYELGEVSKALQSLAAYSPRNLKRYSSSDDGVRTTSSTFTNNFLAIGQDAYGTNWSRQCTATWTRRLKVKAGVLTYDSFSSVGYINPFLTAWELVPYSFVVNWFVNVDTFLKAWAPIVTRQFAHVYTTTSITDELHLTSEYIIPPTISGYSYNIIKNQPSALTAIISSKERKLTTQGPSLQFNVKMNGLKVLDLISLSGQAIDRFVRSKK